MMLPLSMEYDNDISLMISGLSHTIFYRFSRQFFTTKKETQMVISYAFLTQISFFQINKNTELCLLIKKY